MNISLIIFCYNEEGSIGRVLNDALHVLPSFSDSFEIVVVNDGSSDNTRHVCESTSNGNPSVKLISHPQNLGIGRALRSGYAVAQNEYVCAIPGDGQFNINELQQVKPFSAEVYYSFYRPRTNYTFYRSVLTWFNRLFNQHILGVYLRDVNWIKVYRREHLTLVKPELESSLVESEICSKLYKMGVVPIEIPSTYHERTSGVSHGGSWKTLRLAIADTFWLWWKVVSFNPKK